MQAILNHLQLNINFDNLSLYKELMELLEWETLYSGDNMIGFQGKDQVSIWLVAQGTEQQNYDQLGLNHIGFKVPTIKEVDEVVEFIKKKDLAPMFETPRHRPEFAGKPDETYYQVIFITPDNIQIEVLYYGPKQ